MTWVVGATSMFGYGALYSDVQVTFPDGTTRDLVQKAYPITNFIAAGFSGSVQIGFSLLQSLADYTRISEEAIATTAWDPLWIAHRWPSVARDVFQGAPSVEKALGAKFLLLGASPTQNAGLGSRMFLVRFASPEFRPGIMGRFIMSCGIGSGAGVLEYKQWIKPYIRFASRIHHAEVMNPNGWAQELVFTISRAVNRHPKCGISRHFHAVVVRRGQLSTYNNDERIHHPDGSVVEVKMPRVAHSYEEFLEFARAVGSEAICATC